MNKKLLAFFLTIFGMTLLAGCDEDPDAPPPPDTSHVKVFLSSGAFDGDFTAGGAPTGLEGADTACTDAANKAGQSGAWTAWLSDSTPKHAVDRIFDGGVPYKLINGTVIANSKADLLDGTLDAAIIIDESGNTVNTTFDVWTATIPDGTFNTITGDSCLDWSTAVNTESGEHGDANATNNNWTGPIVSVTCDAFIRLYCFANVVTP